MDYKFYFLTYALLVAFVYIINLIKNFGILPSVSESYYHIKHKALFTLFIWSISITMIIVGETGLMFFGGAFLSLVGAAPAIREDFEHKVHSVGAIGGISFATVSMGIDFGLWWITATILGFAMFAIPKKLPPKLDKEWINGIPNPVFWIEMVSIPLIYYGLYVSRVFI